MKAKELAKRKPITIGRNENLLTAKALMKENGIRHLVVIEDAAGYPATVAGVLSERDLFLASLSSLVASGEKAQDAFLESGLVKEAMSAKVVSASPETPIEECARYLREHNIGCLPLIDGEELKGVLTVTDFLERTG